YFHCDLVFNTVDIGFVRKDLWKLRGWCIFHYFSHRNHEFMHLVYVWYCHYSSPNNSFSNFSYNFSKNSRINSPCCTELSISEILTRISTILSLTSLSIFLFSCLFVSIQFSFFD